MSLAKLIGWAVAVVTGLLVLCLGGACLLQGRHDPRPAPAVRTQTAARRLPDAGPRGHPLGPPRAEPSRRGGDPVWTVTG